MYIGHYGTAFAAKSLDKKVSLGTYFLAAQFLDLLFPLFLLLGWEGMKIEAGNTAVTPLNFYYYPFTHSLVGAIVWALVFSSVYFLFKKNFKGSLILGCLVIGHWLLDLITHKPDLQIIPGFELHVGFGLWYSIPNTIIVEGLIFLSGIYFYLTKNSPLNKRGKIISWSLIAFLAVTYVFSFISPTPPSVEPVIWMLFVQWLIVAWAYWADANK